MHLNGHSTVDPRVPTELSTRYPMPNTSFTLTGEDLENAFPPGYLERGVGYFRTGRVLTADYTPAQGLVNGRVRGSGGRVYQCVVQLQRDDAGELTVDGECSCPVGYNCKHVVATLLSLPSLREQSAPHLPPVGSSGLPPEVRNWLSHVERTVTASAAREDPQRLLYLLRCEEQFGLQRILVQAVKVRRLVAGGYGKPQDLYYLGPVPGRLHHAGGSSHHAAD